MDAVPAAQAEILKRWILAGAPLDGGLTPTTDWPAWLREQTKPTSAPEKIVGPVTAVTRTEGAAQEHDTWWLAGRHELRQLQGPGTLLQRWPSRIRQIYQLAAVDSNTVALVGGAPGRAGYLTVLNTAAPNPAEAEQLLAHGPDCFLAVAWEPLSQTLVAAGTDRQLRRWLRQPQGWKPLPDLDLQTDWILSLAFSPDGKKLLTTSRDKTAKVLTWPDANIMATWAGHTQPVVVGRWVNHEQCLTAGNQGELQRWKVGEEGRQGRSQFLGAEPVEIAIDLEGRCAYVLDIQGRLHRLKTEGKDPKPALWPVTFESPPTAIYGVTRTKKIAAGLTHGTLQILDPEAKK
jgi:hypothetical protein